MIRKKSRIAEWARVSNLGAIRERRSSPRPQPTQLNAHNLLKAGDFVPVRVYPKPLEKEFVGAMLEALCLSRLSAFTANRTEEKHDTIHTIQNPFSVRKRKQVEGKTSDRKAG